MNTRHQVPADTALKQEKVSDPSVSAWVSANAGSGKTTVLVRRVIRLLLAGNPPGRVLCLTFTKAAAANMANKVLETLSRWVRLDDAALDQAIREVSPLVPTPALRATARRLFAQALETPGGLKVQTIHAFCDRVLHQFPFEAGVQAGFDVLDDILEADLLRRAREAVLIEAANNQQGELGRALATAVAAATDKSLDEALGEAVRERRKLQLLTVKDREAAIATALGLEPGETTAVVEREIIDAAHLSRSEWAKAAAALSALGGNAAKCAEKLFLAARASDSSAAIDAYLSVFFTGDGSARGESGFGSAQARGAEPELFKRVLAERDRLFSLRERLLAARAAERTAALLTLATATVEKFEANKRARGVLDYADLIEKTADMLHETGAAWVLYKLDGGIDHVLIDEAQDTSPEQWSVIEKLTEEFFAGRGAREDRTRTIFAVGDEKQSIFSFQGADPRLFDEMQKAFKTRVEGAKRRFVPEDLLLSFRSAPGVLGAVDTIFRRPEAFRGLSSGEQTSTIHEAIRKEAPALVEIWETEKPADDEEDALPWDAPLDARGEASPVVRFAQRIAKAVKFWIEGGLTIADAKTRALRTPRAGDVIVLVRQRGPLFDAILQALKRAEIPVAGADRLTLNEHIAVLDLMALGDALMLEQDDLALASVLKSPLFGLDDDDLFELAHGRPGTLAASLFRKAKTEERFKEAAAKFESWRREAAELRPFDFYSRVLGRDKGRERMLARLGLEAADALDEFLARALAYEQTETPSLTGFLSFLRRAGTEVKRDLEVASDAVRVMTVHGAKGLEAPLVVLADTTSIPDGKFDPKLLKLPDSEAFVWGLSKILDSTRTSAAREAASELRMAEYRRLLYVALTRAADALVVCGYESNNTMPEGCWYRLVHDALKASGEADFVETKAPYAEKIWRWRPQEGSVAAPGAGDVRPLVVPPSWLARKPPTLPLAAKRIVPSQFDPDDEPMAPFTAHSTVTLDPRRRGDLVHRLLQRLPEVAASERASGAARLLAGIAGDLAEQVRHELAAEAIAVIDHPGLADLFGPSSRGEIDVLAHIAGADPREIFGRIDRLAVTADEVLVADFKTGKPAASAEDVPPGYVQQLAIYRDAIARIYPGRAMRALLVWTAGPAVHEIDPARLDAALAAAQAQVTSP